MLDKNYKWFIAFLLLAASLYLIHKTFFLTKEFNKGKPIIVKDLEYNILTRNLCIVAELNEKDGEKKEKIMNCALSYFQSAINAFPKKRVDFYVFENDVCEGLIHDNCKVFPCEGRDLKTSKNECYDIITSSDCYSFIVKFGNANETAAYENAIEIFLDERYKEDRCVINVK